MGEVTKNLHCEAALTAEVLSHLLAKIAPATREPALSLRAFGETSDDTDAFNAERYAELIIKEVLESRVFLLRV